MEGLTEGRIVHYVLPDGPNRGQHRPAIVVRVWRSGYAPDLVQLQVFTDGTNDGYAESVIWRTSVHYGSESRVGGPEPGTWHWIERA